MSLRVFVCSLCFILLLSCADSSYNKKISFYHWKSNADFDDSFGEALKASNSEKIYLRYFDVDKIEPGRWGDDGIYPTYVIKRVAEAFKNYEIVPVVFITNQVLMTEDLDTEHLSNRIAELINEISTAHFGKEIHAVQIDCDWTQATRGTFFSLLESLKKQFDINVTIRLHQIKFKEATGIPPVERGTLMLYNVGELENEAQNSILEIDIVKQYINSTTDYPLVLDIALPLFSQTVIKSNDDEIRLINQSVRDRINNDSHFIQIDDNNYRVVADTLFSGFYLSKGYHIKIDEINESEILGAYKVVKDSRIVMDEIIFYHLDEQILTRMDLNKIIREL